MKVFRRASAVAEGSISVSSVRPCVLQRPVHEDAVTCMAAVRPGMVLSGGRDKKIVMTNYETGECVRKWVGHEKEITKVIYKQKGGTHSLFSASRDCSIRLWHFQSPDTTQFYVGHDFAVTGLTAVDDDLICSGSRDNSLKLWDIDTARCIRSSVQPRNMVTHLVWSKTGQFMAQTSEDKELKMWDPRDMSVIHSFPKKQYIQTHCDISADGRYCLSTSNGFNGHGCEISYWDMRERKLIREFKGHEETVSCAIFLTQQITWKKLILSVSADHTTKIWNLEDGNCLSTEYVPSGGSLLAALGFNDGSVVVCGHNACLCQMRLQGRAGKLHLRSISMQVQPCHSQSLQAF